MIEAYCDRCGDVVATIRFEDAFTNAVFQCTRCGMPVYWRNCPDCDAWYCTTDEDAPCPGCQS
jgi:hypothetical protein